MVPSILATAVLLAATSVDPLPKDAKVAVWIFTRDDCPISNRYAPEVRRLYEHYHAQGVSFVLIYPDRDATQEAVDRHRQDFSYPMAGVLDPKHELVAKAGARITPEAAVWIPAGDTWRLIYHGRIDDRYLDFGKWRAEATRHDLAEAIEAGLSGKPVRQAATKAIGCSIVDLR